MSTSRISGLADVPAGGPVGSEYVAIDSPAGSRRLSLTVLSSKIAPAGFLSVIAYGAKGDDPGDGSGTDDGSAFASCFAAAAAGGYGVWIPPPPGGAGKSYRIASSVNVDGGALYQRSIDVVGSGMTSVLIDCPGIEAFVFSNFLQARVRGIAFRGPANVGSGVPKQTVDALTVLSFGSGTSSIVEDCTFKWVAAGNGLIWSSIGGLTVRRVMFMGASATNAFIYATQWKSVVLEDVYANDIGYIAGSTAGSKANALVLIAKHFLWCADATEDLGAWSEQGVLISRCWVDEHCGHNAYGDATPGAGAPIYIRSTTGRASFVRIEDTQVSAGHIPSVETGPVFYIEKVRDLWMKRCTTTVLFGGTMQRDAVSIVDVVSAELDAVRCQTTATTANTIRAASSVGTLTLKNMVQGVDYYALVTSATTTIAPPSWTAAPVLSSNHTYADHGSTLSCTAGTVVCPNGTPTLSYMLEVADGDTTPQAFGTDTPQRWKLQGSTGNSIATPDSTIGFAIRMRVRATDPLTGQYADAISNVLRVPLLETYLGSTAKLVSDERNIVVNADLSHIDSWGSQGAVSTSWISSGVSRPVVGRSLNGYPGLDFDGSVSVMTRSETVSALTQTGTQHTVLAVLIADTVPAVGTAINGAAIISDTQSYWNPVELANVSGGGNNAYVSIYSNTPSGQAIATGAGKLIESLFNSGTPTQSIKVGSAAATTATSAAVQVAGRTNTIQLGHTGVGTGWFDGAIFALVECDSALSGNTLATARAFLGNKYGVAY